MIAAICGGLAFVLVVAGIVPVLRAQSALEKSLERLEAHQERIDPARLNASIERISAAIEGLQPLAVRAAAAFYEINRGLRKLRLPEAFVAVRLAATAVRALHSLH